MPSFKQQADQIARMVSNTDNHIDAVARKLGLANQNLANGLSFQRQRDTFAKEIVIHPFFKNMQ